MFLRLFVVVLLLGSCGAEAQSPTLSGFVTLEGTFPFYGDARVLEIFSKDEALNYRVKFDLGIIEPVEAFIEKGSPWFAYVESKNSVWIFNGKDDLVVWELIDGDSWVSSLTVKRDYVLEKVPDEVRARIPELLAN